MPDATPNMRRRPQRPALPENTDTAASDRVLGRQADVHSEPGRPNPYPHRLSVDIDDERYRRLKRLALEEGRYLVDVVREALDEKIAEFESGRRQGR